MRDQSFGARDRALFLIGFAGALRRSELVGLDLDHVTWITGGLKLLIEPLITNAKGEGVKIAIPPGSAVGTCPIAALQAWLEVAKFAKGPISFAGSIEAAESKQNGLLPIACARSC